VRNRAEALAVGADPFFIDRRVQIVTLATRKFSYPRSDGSAWTLTGQRVRQHIVEDRSARDGRRCRGPEFAKISVTSLPARQDEPH
jgi:hypothetical protein